MTVQPDLDASTLREWIGREARARDEITPRLVEAFNATFGLDDVLPPPGAPAPAAFHWCLAPPVARAGALGEDGHHARSGFLPPVPLQL